MIYEKFSSVFRNIYVEYKKLHFYLNLMTLKEHGILGWINYNVWNIFTSNIDQPKLVFLN